MSNELNNFIAEQHAAGQRDEYGYVESGIDDAIISSEDFSLEIHPEIKRQVWDSLKVLPNPEKTFEGDKEALDDYKYFEIWKDAHDTMRMLDDENPHVPRSKALADTWDYISNNKTLMDATLRHYDRIQEMPMSKVYGSVFGGDFNKVAKRVAAEQERAKPENWERVYH